jgi:RNA polymerase sigma-70 factor (ECF subfamily)
MHERVHALRNREVLGAWLYWVVRNVIADRYRARRRLGEPPNEDDLVADNDGMPRDVKAELAVCVAPFVARLPSPYREAVTVVDIEGLSLKEAAAMVGISTTAMKSRVQRGRARLREIFARRAAARRRLSLQAGTGPLRRRLSSIAQVTPRS